MAIDATIPRWPTASLVPQQVSVAPVRPVIAGPQPITGRPQTVASSAGAWRVALNNVRLYGHSRVRDMRALLFGRLAQGLPVYVPLFDWRRSPRARAGLAIYATAPAGLLSSPYVQSAGDAQVTSPALAQAVALTVDTTAPIILQPGDYIGLDERVHVLRGAIADGTVPNRFALTIWPPLRKSVAAGQLVELSDPCLRAVADPKDMEAALTLDLDRVGSLTVTLFEANWA